MVGALIAADGGTSARCRPFSGLQRRPLGRRSPRGDDLGPQRGTEPAVERLGGGVVLMHLPPDQQVLRRRPPGQLGHQQPADAGVAAGLADVEVVQRQDVGAVPPVPPPARRPAPPAPPPPRTAEPPPPPPPRRPKTPTTTASRPSIAAHLSVGT